TKAKAPSPGILNIMLISGLNMLPMKLTTPNPINISTQIKKGNKAGQTTLNQRSKPSNEALYASSGNIIMLDIIKRNNKALKYKVKYFLIIASPKIEDKIIYYINRKNNYTHYFYIEYRS
ncbi:MAG: hypothetical protein WCY24_07075, partial [Lutispora sp.]